MLLQLHILGLQVYATTPSSISITRGTRSNYYVFHLGGEHRVAVTSCILTFLAKFLENTQNGRKCHCRSLACRPGGRSHSCNANLRPLGSILSGWTDGRPESTCTRSRVHNSGLGLPHTSAPVSALAPCILGDRCVQRAWAV
jgi:hypothetical protein